MHTNIKTDWPHFQHGYTGFSGGGRVSEAEWGKGYPIPHFLRNWIKSTLSLMIYGWFNKFLYRRDG